MPGPVGLPVDRPTSCAFGGVDRATLFITTARHGLDEEAMARQPDAGRVFRVDGLQTRRAVRALPRDDRAARAMRLLVLGGGPAGLNAALHARELGAEVTLVEAKQVGGTMSWSEIRAVEAAATRP
jgi:heterodisulfide reductase subunit A-like polyferredoxin